MAIDSQEAYQDSQATFEQGDGYRELEQSTEAYTIDSLAQRREEALSSITRNAEGRQEDEEIGVERFKLELLHEAERFDRIFETEKGSIYFVAPDGSSLRLNGQAEGLDKVQPIMAKQLFVDSEVAERMKVSQGAFLAVGPLPKAEYGPGAYALELDLPEKGFDEDEYSLTVKKVPTGIHVGDRVSRIIR